MSVWELPRKAKGKRSTNTARTRRERSLSRQPIDLNTGNPAPGTNPDDSQPLPRRRIALQPLARWSLLGVLLLIASLAGLELFHRPGSGITAVAAPTTWVPLVVPAPLSNTTPDSVSTTAEGPSGVIKAAGADGRASTPIGTDSKSDRARSALPGRTNTAIKAPALAAPAAAASSPINVAADVVPTTSPAAPPTPSAAPPPTNHWQELADTVQQCPNGLLDRISCEQSTRLQFCEGYWGRVPQCPAGIANDHGQ